MSNPKTNSVFQRFTHQLRLLGVISLVIFTILLFAGVKLVNDFNYQIQQTQDNIKLSARPLNQLQRQVFLLWLMVKNDPQTFNPDAAKLQVQLIKSQIVQVYEISFDVALNPQIRENFDQSDKFWQHMQPKIEAWQANPRDPAIIATLLEDVATLEKAINSISTDYIQERRLKNETYIKNTQNIFNLLEFVLFGLLGLAATISIATYYFIRERQNTLHWLQRTNDELETRVEQRTYDLQENNKLLQREVLERQQAQAELSAANQRLQEDLQTARLIQQGLLPAVRPPWQGLDIICYNTPAREVGGDFYAYHRFDANSFAITIGDVSGKGMPAALLMATSLAHFDSALAYKLSPSHLLNHLDQALLRYTQPTHQNCALCYVELTRNISQTDLTWRLQFVNAGGIPPFIKRQSGAVEWPELGGFALGQGLGSEIGYRQLELALVSHDMVILTSDGVAEAMNQAQEFLGFERLETLIRLGPSTSAQAMLTHLVNGITQFVGTADPHDDLTIVVVQV